MIEKKIYAYVELLDEGTESWRVAEVTEIGDGLYRVVQGDNYNPEDEAWAYVPGTEVRLKDADTVFGRLTTVVHLDSNVIRIMMPMTNSWADARGTHAEHLGDGKYKILPTPNYPFYDGEQIENWDYPPGSIVELEERKWAGTEKTYLEPVRKVEEGV